MPVTQRGTRLVAPTPGYSNNYGQGAALSSNGLVLAVGEPELEPGALVLQGGVHTYDLVSGAWVVRGSVLLAADAADNDRFGASVCLSADGLVLVVGVPGRADASFTDSGIVKTYDWVTSAWVLRGANLLGTTSNLDRKFGVDAALSDNGNILAVGSITEGVLIFDRSGSTWVQRGTALLAAAGIEFGASVSLNGAGAMLAVGAPGYDAALTNVGRIYIYDYVTAWTLRGVIEHPAPNTTVFSAFGVAAALTTDGLVLAVGTSNTSTFNDDRGGFYIFDYVASAWVQRGAVVTVTDTTPGLGNSVAISSDGAVIVSGGSNYTGTVTLQGALYTFDVTSDNFASAPTTLTIVASTGTATAPTLLTVTDYAAAPTTLTITSPFGAATAPTLLTVTDAGIVTAPTLLAVVVAGDVPEWRARCTIGGVDVSASLVGAASVSADEGAARVAEITILPPSGVVAPLDYVGKSITLDYVLIIAGVEVPLRLFTGRIDTPDYDPDTSLLRFDCVDDLQNRVSALARTVIAALIGGRYTEAVQGPLDDGWDYAEAMLSTVAASLDAGASGGLRVTPWQSAAVWATYDASALLYQRSSVTFPQRSTIVNKVDIAFDYRYPRLRQRYTSLGWSGTQIDMAPCGYAYPTQQDILGAADGSGWKVTLGVFYPAPASIPHSSGGFIFPAEGSIDMAILKMTQRHSQTVTEAYAVSVAAPESVTANGELRHALRGALESSFDGQAWESALDVTPLMPTGGEQDYAPDAPRVNADYALQTLIDQAKVKILASHRGARVANAILCNPDLDLDKRVAIATSAINAQGKVASVRHVLDFDAGSATTEFSIACSGAGGAGILTPDTLAPPPPPASAVETQDWPAQTASLFVNTFGVTPYSENLMGLLLNPPETISVDNVPPENITKSFANAFYVPGSYPVTGYRVRMPGVDDADRNPIVKPVASSLNMVVPVDTLTFTAP